MSLKPFSQFRKTTGFRLALWYSAFFICSALLIFALAYFLVSSTIREKDQNMIRTKIEEYLVQDNKFGRPSLLSEIRLEQSNNEKSGFFIRVADLQNRTLILTLPHQWQPEDVSSLEKESPSFKDGQWAHLQAKNDEEMVLEFTGYHLSGGFILQLGRDSKERERLLERFGTVFAGIILPVILIGFGGGFFLAFRALQPIRDLIQTVKSIDIGKMDARVKSRNTDDELDELVKLFNNMLQKIETLITGMRETLDNVAHDLRTPVTRLRASIETALQDESDVKTLREALMDCAEESERLITMLKTLMDISEAETGVMELHLERINFVTTLKEVVEFYRYAAEEKKIRIEVTFPEKLYVTADANRIRQAFANLIDNAIKYTPDGGQISMDVCLLDGEVTIRVKDTGSGISPHDLPRIFDRLYRGDKSRSVHKGLGLGLSLVQAIIHAHNGRIKADSLLGKGSEFTMILPADPQVTSC